MKNRRGMTLVEIIITVALFLVVSLMVYRSLGFMRNVMFQQSRLTQLVALNEFNYDLARTIRSARRIRPNGVTYKSLDLELYDYKNNPPVELSNPLPIVKVISKGAVQNFIRVVYRYDDTQNPPVFVRETYNPPTAALPSQTEILLKNVDLFPPQDTADGFYFKSNYQVGNLPSDVLIAIRLKSPFFKTMWTPVNIEAAVYGQGI